MAPRFAFRASKFRNVECKRLPSFDQLQVSSDGTVLAATSSSFAFAHQMDNEGAIQVKSLAQTGKEAPNTPPLTYCFLQGTPTPL
ncbi:hypothetical protein PI126_g11879 [Phytophthora idaei]|nr:hypothetical protein PI126_g11879 [Phytophthora idaei]